MLLEKARSPFLRLTIIPLRVYIPQSLYPCILQRHSDCFLILAIVNNAVKYTHRKPSNCEKMFMLITLTETIISLCTCTSKYHAALKYMQLLFFTF